MNYTIYKKDKELASHIYKEINPYALEISNKYELDNEQFNLFNFLSYGEFYFEDGDGDMYFNPKSKGIGWSHDREYVAKRLKPLIKDGIVKLEKKRAGNRTNWYFYDARYKLTDLAESSCFMTNYYVHEIRKNLGLPYAWWYNMKHEETVKYNDYETTITKKKNYTIISVKYGTHQTTAKMETMDNYFVSNMKNIMSFITMIKNIGTKQLEFINDENLEKWFSKQYGTPPHNTKSLKYNPQWKIIENKDYMQDTYGKYEVFVERVEGGNIRGLGGHDEIGTYGYSITIYEHELNEHGFTCQKE